MEISKSIVPQKNKNKTIKCNKSKRKKSVNNKYCKNISNPIQYVFIKSFFKKLKDIGNPKSVK